MWRITGILGPRSDGRRYYVFTNNECEVHYKWDREFWYPTAIYEKMSKVNPKFESLF